MSKELPWFNFIKTDQHNDNAGNYALLTNLQAYRPMVGPGVGYQIPWRAFAPQNYQNAAVTTLTGLGGIVQGQVILQPLSDPYNGA